MSVEVEGYGHSSVAVLRSGTGMAVTRPELTSAASGVSP
jgi:hypothetical protein